MVKVLICGDIQGQWDILIEKIKLLHASTHGPFQAVLAVGQLMETSTDPNILAAAWQTLCQRQDMPIPFYFLVNESENVATEEMYKQLQHHAQEEEGKIGHNLYFLGFQGIRKVQGLNVAFLSGRYSEKIFGDSCDKSDVSFYKYEQVKKLMEDLGRREQSVDILLTSEYPKSFQKHVSEVSLPEVLKENLPLGFSEVVATIAAESTPRYHFVGSLGVFYQRPPYITETKDEKTCVTRLIGLGKVSLVSDKTNKWINALNLTALSSSETVPIPKGSTISPYVEVPSMSSELKPDADLNPPKVRRIAGMSEDRAKLLLEMDAQKQEQFFYDPQSMRGRGRGRGDRGRRGFQQHRADPRKDCWFCLATPNIEKHLLASVSIGMESYLALPKGGIVPGHILIVPISHEECMARLPAEVVEEVEKYKIALRKLYASKGKDVIVFDRNIITKGAMHGHLQVVPIPKSARASAKDLLDRESLRYNMDFKELLPTDSLKDVVGTNQYFYLELPSTDESSKVIRLVHIISGRYFLQFGRQYAAMLLGLPERADWKNCVVSQRQEEDLVTQFKKDFESFDITLNK